MNTADLPLLRILKRLFTIFAVLVLVAACLYWRIPLDNGFTLVFAFVPFSALIAVLGTIVLCVALWRAWLPWQGRWVTAGVLLWVLAPILAGPIFALAITDLLENYYDSPAYAAWYNHTFGITIAPQGQSFQHTQCSLESYSATYTVTASRDRNLAFALLDRSDLRAIDVGDGPERSIGSRFAYVGVGPYALVDQGRALGVYHVPAGTHTLVVRADSPFQLSIADGQPLWAPDLWLRGAERYHTLYTDNHTWEELVPLWAQSRPADCPPLCTRLDMQPATSVADTIFQPKANLRTVVSETPVDADGDGYYDTLDLAVLFRVQTPGDYVLEGSLYAASALESAKARYFTDYVEPLCSGVHTATLRFDGRDLRSIGAGGPYTLTLALRRQGLGLAEDTTDNVYVTAPYTHWPFAGAPPTAVATVSGAAGSDTTSIVIGRCAHPDQPSRNDNYLYDRLAISAGLPGLDLPEGEYDWRGSLLAADCAVIDTAAGAGRIAQDGVIDLAFSGSAIRRLGIDGPYTLGNVTITGRTPPRTTITLPALCTTEELRAWQFEP